MITSFKPVCVLAPAKINLCLEVHSKRFDGYHNISSILCPVSLYDSLYFTFSKDKYFIRVVSDTPYLDIYENNIVYKTIKVFFNELYRIGTSISNLGVKVYLKKKIPIGAGFGGGSSDAASTLLLLNERFGFQFSKKELINMGRKVGADVPFFIFGKPAVVKGIGDDIEPFTGKLPNFALLVHTGLFVSTSWVYENLSLNNNLRLTKDKKKINKSNLIGNDFDYKKCLFNDLESVSELEFPIISEVKAVLLGSGALSVLMSGSGSGVFGIFDDAEIVRLVYRKLKQDFCYDNWSIHLVTFLFRS